MTYSYNTYSTPIDNLLIYLLHTINTLLIPIYTLLTLINVVSALIIGTLTKKKKKIDFFVDYTAYNTLYCIFSYVFTMYLLLTQYSRTSIIRTCQDLSK